MFANRLQKASAIAGRRSFSSVAFAGLDGKVQYKAPTQLLINGEFVDAVSGKTVDVTNPSTGKVFTQVASAGAADVEKAFQAAQAAQDGAWGDKLPAERALLMNRFADILEAHTEELACLESTDNGKSIDASRGEMGFAISCFRYYAGLTQSIDGKAFECSHNPNQLNYIRREPIGVCGIITPWNFPFLMTTWKMAPLLAAGCTGVFKIPENTPLSSLRFGQLWTEMEGSVPGVINMVPGLGSEAGEAIVDHPGIRKIAFTGSTAVGKSIMAKSAAHVKRVTLELGGKSPFVVFDDADLDKAALHAYQQGFRNSGQFCVQPSRMLVQENAYDGFVDRLVALTREMPVGAWNEKGTFMGPQISQAAADKIMSYIDIGKKSGAKLVIGGERVDRDGFFVKPTIFTNADNSMRQCREEIFGPVLNIIKFKTIEEGIAIANDSDYGLTGAVYTKSWNTAHIATKKIQTG